MQPATVSPTLQWMVGLCPWTLPSNSQVASQTMVSLFTVRMVLTTDKILGYTPCEKAPKQANRNPGLKWWGWGGAVYAASPLPQAGPVFSQLVLSSGVGRNILQKPTVAHAGGLEGLYPGSSDPLCSTFCPEHSSSGLSHAPPPLLTTAAPRLMGHPHPAPFSRTRP